MSTALSKALAGEKVSESAAPKALAEAADKIKALKVAAQTAKENAGTTAEAGIHVLETVGTLAVAGAAEGYWGEEKMKLANVPVRGAGGLLLTAWGLGRTMMGKNGGHQTAIGTGLLGAEAYSMGRAAGIALREKKAGSANGAPAAQPTAAQQQLLAANPGAQLVNGKVVSAQGVALEGDDLAELSRLVRLQAGTEGEPRERVPARRALPDGAPRRARAAFGVG